MFFLSKYLERAGCSIHNSKDDADVLIVQTAAASARSKDTVVVGGHHDLLVLLQHAEMNAHELFLKSEPKNLTQQTKSWCIKQTKESLGPEICDNILFIHSFLGCNATSRPYG